MATPTATGQIRGYRGQPNELLKLCQDYYRISTVAYEDTSLEGKEIIDMYHNRQYTQAQLLALAENGQPAETFNIIKLMTNVMIGYLDTVVTTMTVEPRYPQQSVAANLINDVTQATLADNDWTTIEKFCKIDGILTGMMCVYEEVVPTGGKDQFGRDLYNIMIEHTPSWQVRIDPQANREDYNDARFIHHFKWVPEETLKKMYPKKWKDLVEYHNFLEADPQAEWERQHPSGHDVGKYKEYNNYLLVKTVVKDKGKTWSVVWSDEIMLEKKEITYKNVQFPYRIMKMSKSDIAEYYGPFRDIVETQKAINQALLQIQLLSNTSKAFVEDGAVEDLEEFRELFNRINAIIPVVSLQGIQVENMSRDIIQQYTIIDKAFERIKLILGINDSMLGAAYASDSGRKVQIQQLASAAQMTMLVDRVVGFFRFIGQDIVKFIDQYYRGTQIFKIADPLNTYHYIEINQPLMRPVGPADPVTGVPPMAPVMVPSTDPETGELELDDQGNIIMIPLNDPRSDVQFTAADVKVRATKADNAQEKNQIMFETFVNGPAGQVLLQTNPAGYLRTLAMQVSEMGTKQSVEIAKILMETAIGIEQGRIDPRLAMVGGDVQAIMGAAMGGSTGNSQNAPQMNTGQQPGNTGNVPKVGREGGRP